MNICKIHYEGINPRRAFTTCKRCGASAMDQVYCQNCGKLFCCRCEERKS